MVSALLATSWAVSPGFAGYSLTATVSKPTSTGR